MTEREEQVDDGPVDDTELEQNIGPDDLELDKAILSPRSGVVTVGVVTCQSRTLGAGRPL